VRTARGYDTQLQIFGPEDRFPIRSEMAFPPPPNSYLEDYRAARDRFGLTRAVVVQPAAYGVDNCCTMAAIESLGADACGAAVVLPEVEDDELAWLSEDGIYGLRLFMSPSGALGRDVFKKMAARVYPFGWYVQLQMDGRLMHEFETLLASIPNTLVINHLGKFVESVEPDQPGVQTVLLLVKTSNFWF